MDTKWPENRASVPDEAKPFFDKRSELSWESGILMWGSRIIIPSSLKTRVLNILHEGHPGIESMRSIARYHVWWPQIDRDIDSLVKGCNGCQENRDTAPEVPLYSWNIPDHPWQRIHLDITGPFDGKYWLVIIDALTKWPEVESLDSIKAENVIDRLRPLFARHGVPMQIVTDNGPQFKTSCQFVTEFDDYCKKSGIKHIRITPYHPKTNGLVERFNRTFKQRYLAARQDTVDRNLIVSRFLFSYRNTPNKTTGKSPAEMWLGRRLPSVLDRIKPDPRKRAENQLAKQKAYHDRRAQGRTFQVGDDVWVKNENTAGWTPGVILRKTGEPYSYEVMVGGVTKKRHADQLRLRSGAIDEFEERGRNVEM